MLIAASPLCRGSDLGSLLACRELHDASARLACFDREADALAGKPAQNPGAPETSASVPGAPERSASPASAPSPGGSAPVAPLAAPPAAPPPAPAPAAAPVVPPPTPAPGAAPAAPRAESQTAPLLEPAQTFGLPPQAIAQREVAAGKRKADLNAITATISRLSTSPTGRVVFTLDNDQVWEEVLNEGDLLAREGQRVEISRGLFGSYLMKLPSGRGCKVHRLR